MPGPFPDRRPRAADSSRTPRWSRTLRSDGQPVSVATWYLLEDDDRVLLNMDHTRVRLQHLRRRPPGLADRARRAAGWYTHVSLIGRVDELRDDEGLVDIDRLSNHYGGRVLPESPRTSAWLAVEVARLGAPRG